MCNYCKQGRNCACLVDQCVWDTICNRRCDQRHTDIRPVVCEDCGNSRTPRCHGCHHCQYRKTQKDKGSKLCSNSSCTKPQDARMSRCSVDCYMAATPVEQLRHCNIGDCDSVAPPGNGARCSYHVKLAQKETRSRKAKEQPLVESKASSSKKGKRQEYGRS